MRPVTSRIASPDRDLAQERQQGYPDRVWDINRGNCCDKGNCIGGCFTDRALVLTQYSDSGVARIGLRGTGTISNPDDFAG